MDSPLLSTGSLAAGDPHGAAATAARSATARVRMITDRRQFAELRLFPDQIGLCGLRSVYVPYVAPGFELANEIRSACIAYTEETGLQPKTILLENHGLIALGKTPKEAVSACLMTEKAAQVFSVANDPHPLTPEEVKHIHTWTDEHFRQGKIWEE